MASHLSVHSHQKGLSAIQRKIPRLMTLLKITRTDWPRRLETRLNFFLIAFVFNHSLSVIETIVENRITRGNLVTSIDQFSFALKTRSL